MKPEPSLGATYLGEGRCRFCVWAPLAQRVEVRIVSQPERVVSLEQAKGYHLASMEKVEPGSLYFYRLDGQKERPDPASHFQPQGVHGPSQVVDPDFPWKDETWLGLPLQDYIIYELHVGTFTPGGTLEAIIAHLDELKDLGITAVEIMPVSQFPGNRNWGYDGVYPFAVQNSYGGPAGLKKLVNACHQQGLAVVLDVVYNHLGPEGNYLRDFGPYFTDRYQTPWGQALNFDGPYSDEVRRFFVENALYWVREYHIDALRLDALHAIFDSSAQPFFQDLAAVVHLEGERRKRKVYLFAESDRNDVRFIQHPDRGGYGLDAHWNDDFHHALHTLLTGERAGYYLDFGSLRDLAKAYEEGFIYSGQYSPYRKRRHGSPSHDLPAYRFVVFAQNHDQVGNRMLGERLSQLVPLEALKLAAGVVLLSPFIPLLFMGEEYGETSPFLYFISHTDPALVEAVRRGRKEEFSGFAWHGELADPQDEGTFLASKLQPELRSQGHHPMLREFYKELIRLRRTLPALAFLSKKQIEVVSREREKVLLLRRWQEEDGVFMVFNFGNLQISVDLPVPAGPWRKLFDSEDDRWYGSGSSIPGQIQSTGRINMTLHPQAFSLFARVKGV
ncbi:MAG: malto-oligosyltrehalose trehalohydrolase [Thermodesulfobacteriota bacterium]|nr:malto-oligosyltrehalose trehalohydrolase [Thermodesulfobacteriota bacterium]